MVHLIINADDLGIDPQRDAGILEAWRAGAITQASLMVNGPSAETAAPAARDAGLPLGVHLDLTEMPPSARPSEVRSLLDEQGRKLGKHGLREALAAKKVTSEAIEAETRAQLARFEELTSSPARHVDGHQHVHTIPDVARVLAPLFATLGVKTTRIPEQEVVGGVSPEALSFYQGVAADGRKARAIFAAAGIRSTDAFVGLDTMGMAMSAEALRQRISRSAASVELMCHPGHVGIGGDDFNRSEAREHELEVLSALPFQPFIDAGWLKLGPFSILVPSAPGV